MSFVYQDVQHHKTLNRIYTPHYIAKFLYQLTKHVRPKVIFDPGCGSGNLLLPWVRSGQFPRICIGLDNNMDESLFVENFEFKLGNFETFEPEFVPDLVVCNPPWSGHWNRESYPDIFFKRIIELFGPKIPLIFLCPMGFRLNQKIRSARRQRFLKEGPEISSIISCPIDMYKDTLFHSEILIFNIKRLKPHYWAPNS